MHTPSPLRQRHPHSPASASHSSNAPAPPGTDDDATARGKRRADENSGSVSPYRSAVPPGAAASAPPILAEQADPSMQLPRRAIFRSGYIEDRLVDIRLKKLNAQQERGHARCAQNLVLAQRRLQQAAQPQASSASADIVPADCLALATEIEALMAELDRYRMMEDPAALLDALHSEKTLALWQAYSQSWSGRQHHYLHTKQGRAETFAWNLAAGAFAYLACFGPGAVAAAISGNPWLGAAVSSASWTLCEPMIAMIRATSWSNPALEAYGPRQHLWARALREAIDRTSGLEKNRKYLFIDGNGAEQWLNAAGYLERCEPSWVALWSRKLGPDDLPYTLYAACNSIRNLFPDWIGMPNVYRQSLSWNAGSRLIAGGIAGPLTMVAIQALRSCMDDARETVTMPREVWRQLAACLASLRADLDAAIGNESGDMRMQRLLELRDVIDAMLDKARQKSDWLPSIAYEWRTLFQRKREAVGVDVETPGKRLDTAAGMLGKFLCQLPGAGAAELAKPLAASNYSLAHALGNIAPPVTQILGPFAFVFRKELEAAARVACGGLHGLCNRVRSCCGKKPDEEE
jgi:hypothetical protein